MMVLIISITAVSYRSWGSSVLCLTTDWTSGVRSPAEAKIVPPACVQTSIEAHPASYPMGTVGFSPGVKRGRGVTLTTHPHLLPRSRMSRSYATFS
jgi:hypothetical protein